MNLPRPSAVAALFVLSLTAGLARPALSQDGFADPTFSDDGVQVVTWGGNAAGASAVAATARGELFVGGTWASGGNIDLAVVKLTTAGEIDSSWAVGGRRIVAFDAIVDADDDLRELSLRPDGSLLLAGWSRVDDANLLDLPALAMLTSGGTLDTSWGDNGLALFDLPWPTDSYGWNTTLVQPDGKVLFAGYCYDCPENGSDQRPMLLRVTPEGVADPAFSGDGWEAPTTGVWSQSYPYALALDDAGRILVFGTGPAGFALFRLTPSGALDLSFGGGDGSVEITMPAGHAYPYALTRDPSTGALFLSLSFTSGPYDDHAGVLRFAADGAPDNTFAGDGLAELLFDDRLRVLAIAPQTDGMLVGSGFIWNVGSDTDFCIFRLEADGDLDPTFHSNGVRRIEFGQTPDLSDYGRSITLSGGRLVVVGPVPTAGVESYGIARTTSRHIFTDGFDRGSSASWLGN